MKVKRIKAHQFKRFADLTVREVPESAKLVMLAGPNGSGKSSLFEAMHTWHKNAWRGHGGWDDEYHLKRGAARTGWNKQLSVEFWSAEPENQEEKKKAIYIRTAYRNEADFRVSSFERSSNIINESNVERLIDNDVSVGKNYKRMISNGVEDLFSKSDKGKTFEQYREETLGEIARYVGRLFPDLLLNDLGNPFEDGTFRFKKGDSDGFQFKNLSGGEKAVFDLILDLVIVGRVYNNTVFCIDEPEAHMNARLHAELVAVLCDIVPEECQLWLATHSIGMMRKASDMARDNPGTVAFIDFGGRNFDDPQILTPIQPNRAFWQRAYEVALDDLSTLVAPERVVICEGGTTATGARGSANFDSDCYNTIFEEEFPETRFIPGGDSVSVERDRLALMQSIQALVTGASVVRLIDRDDHSELDVAEKQRNGVHVLSRRAIENFLFADEVLGALCASEGKPEVTVDLKDAKQSAINESVGRGNPRDDLKSAAGGIYNAAKQLLQLTGKGNDWRGFARSTLAPLIRPGMTIYEELKRDIFGI